MHTSGPDLPGIFKYSLEELMVVFDMLTGFEFQNATYLKSDQLPVTSMPLF